MKMLSVRELRNNAAQVWERLPKEREMVVTNNGAPVAILSCVGVDEVEESLAAIRSARATSAVARLQQRSVERGLDKLTAADIQKEITAARRNYRR